MQKQQLRLPVDTIKLDKRFIDDIEKNESARTLAQSIAGICKSLQLNIVAEGVETDAQLEILRGQGYQIAQGYCFSRPLVPQDLAQGIRERFLPIDDSERYRISAPKSLL